VTIEGDSKMYYTWFDIDWKLNSDRKSWPECWLSIEIYPDELIINHTQDTKDFKTTENYLEKTFGTYWNNKEREIIFQVTDRHLKVLFDSSENDNIQQPISLPLFKKSFLGQISPSNFSLTPFPVPVIAFHSYKGGVGRTLSLFSLVREVSLDLDLKTLIVDADIEAPGLTVMAEGFPRENRISYSDILTIIHDSNSTDLFENIVQRIAKSMTSSTIKIPAHDTIKEHYFLPAYRMNYQLLDNFVHPEHIISMPERAFIISDFLSKLGKQLNVDVVIIDLRAGLSELSAPVLFDPRVRRIFVTSTSIQSTVGTKFILDTIFKSPFSSREIIQEAIEKQKIMSPTILINMVPDGFEEDLSIIKQDIIPPEMTVLYSEQHSEQEPDDGVLSDVIIYSYFSDSFIHLENLQQICRLLSKTPSMLQMTEKLVKRVLPASDSPKKRSESIVVNFRDNIINDINGLVSGEITAEGSSLVNMMTTEALENLAKDYAENVPKVVILGAKGSGKTYIYKQLLKKLYWNNFVNSVLSPEVLEQDTTLIMPVLATANRRQFASLFDSCFTRVNEILGTNATQEILTNNEKFLNESRDNKSLKQNDWGIIWNKFFLKSLPLKNKGLFGNIDQLDSTLSSIGKKIIFIIDGLEDIFNQSINSENTKIALSVLYQDFINSIEKYRNVGLIVFSRNDLAQNAIQQGKGNYEQFKSQYSSYSLKWSQDEALRLVIWILAQVKYNSYDKDKAKIPKLTHDAIGGFLNPFWGLKLGSSTSNEAISARWIIAALSDFNKQIQARDIIRFLKYATENPGKDLYYHDRILLPNDIRKSIEPCSRDKREEITTEMKNLVPVFKKLEEVRPEKKELPLPLNTEIINAEERGLLEAQGYLTITKDGYYLPEIIRHALGYRYSHGGRPKVLSLLIDNRTLRS
jgi:MinD-like ATPase involved in chromosome partitioning or flagellar assembly